MSTRRVSHGTQPGAFDRARIKRLTLEITAELQRYGAVVARTDEVGDPEVWRMAARKAAHDLGTWCVTGYYGPANELVWARPQNRPVTAADRREARRAVEDAAVAAMGAALSEKLLPD